MRHGGQILVDQLRINKVQRVFFVPGESFLPVLDGLFDSGIDSIVGRQEGGVCMMAEAHGKLTGLPGIAFVTRGPGATNACSGIHVAFHDSTPMILFVGQVETGQRDRESFQEIDYRQMFSPLAKWVAEIDRIDRIPEYLSQAFHIAVSGRPGPVVLSIPEDVLFTQSGIKDALPAYRTKHTVGDAQVSLVLNDLMQADRPFIIVGGSSWNSVASRQLGDLAERLGIPVCTSFRRQDYLDNRHPNYAGDIGISPNPKLKRRLLESDCILVLGTRLGEITSSSYQIFDIPNPKQKLLHIYPDGNEFGRVYRPHISLICTAPVFVETAVRLVRSKPLVFPVEVRKEYEMWQIPSETPGSVKMEQIINYLSNHLSDDAIIASGAGNYAGWLHRYFRYKSFQTQLAPTSGSMGYALPAAISAKLSNPGREVICLTGDGCFQMTMQEFGTAMQYGLKIIVIIINNGQYGTIRMHQEKKYPDRPSGTKIKNPDFAGLANCYGAIGYKVYQTNQFPDALSKALASESSSIIEIQTDPCALSQTTTV